MFQGRFRDVLRDPQEKGFSSSKGSKRSSNGVSRQFQGHFREVSRVFKVSVNFLSRKFQIKFQECFNNVPIYI